MVKRKPSSKQTVEKDGARQLSQIEIWIARQFRDLPGLSMQRRAVVRRGDELVMHLIADLNYIANPEHADADVVHHVQRVDTHCKKVGHGAMNGLHPAISKLILVVDYAARRVKHRSVKPLPTYAEQLAMVFSIEWPEYPLKREHIVQAINAWSTPQKWEAIRELARSSGMEPPSANRIKQAISRAGQFKHRTR